jgi:GTP pyrophosphokinase
MAHLLGVASLVMGEAGHVDFAVTEDMVIAALLHDAAEDHGGILRLIDIEYNFGADVARIVSGLTDSFAEDSHAKEPWLERKHAYLDRLRKEPPDVQLVSAADKLYNARAILEDYRVIGAEIWGRFRRGRRDQIWYFDALLEIYEASGRNRIVDELWRVVAELKRLSETENDAGRRTNRDGDGGKLEVRETVLEVGAEGGSLAIIRERNTQGTWEYWALRDEATIADLLPDEEFGKGELIERSAHKPAFEDALSLLDQYPWFRLIPMMVHPEFEKSILREVETRGGKEAAENWIRNWHGRRRFD